MSRVPKILRLKQQNELEEFLSGVEKDNYETIKELEEMDESLDEEEEYNEEEE